MFSMYAMYDRVSKDFRFPFCAKNDDCAVRAVKNSSKNIELSEYKLFRLGSFNEDTGEITSCRKEEIKIV